MHSDDGGPTDPGHTTGATTRPISIAATVRDPRTVAIAADAIDVRALLSDGERYELREVIGRGGMGEVWLAEDRQIGREVAIKVARETADADALARFVREARIQGQLDHPSVVPVHEVGTRDGATYFTMKRIHGESLAALAAALAAGDVEARKRATPRRILTAFVSACHAIEMAHTRGLIHRDLKPGNIMLGERGEVYVLDWGLAKIASADELPVSAPSLPSPVGDALTEVGQLLGTPGYMAPEQARGGPIDVRADVYALGASLYEVLTHRPLVPRGSTPAVIAATLEGIDVRAGFRGGTAIAPELEEICVRATALRPGDRFPNVAALREAIERYLDGDRDLERRLALADRAVADARRDHPAALAGEAAPRALALAALGRALALDPTHAEAQRLLMELMVAPPRETPPEVERAVAAAENATYTALAGAGAWIYVLWLPLALVLVWMGLRNVDPMLGWVGFTVATTMTLLTAKARGRADPFTYFASLVLSCTAIAIATRVSGTMILTPTLFTMNAVGFAAAARRSWLAPTVAISVAYLVAPPILEALGWITATTVVDGGAIHVTSTVVVFSEPQATVAAIGAAVLFLIMVAVAAGRIRARMLAQTRRAELAAWQLRQLVPKIER